jgi:aspartyl protease family protein
MRADDPYGSPSGGGTVGWALRQLAIWGGLTLLLYAVVGNRAWFQPAQPVQSPAVQAPAVQVHTVQASGAQPAAANPSSRVPINTLSYRADQRGHVMLEAAVNGAPTRFLVDTGATIVALTPSDAAAAGLGRSNLSFSATVSTANGVARAAPVKLREVRIGQLALPDVPAMVIENLGVSLLGQSFLKRLDAYEMRDGVLTITWN